ncbi:hypothetical protein ColTof3_14724 [Colletotrichum tofieldiae]|nr:hypothetical protein ColTof3_14724 [Colletotrichum tofieldiae]
MIGGSRTRQAAVVEVETSIGGADGSGSGEGAARKPQGQTIGNVAQVTRMRNGQEATESLIHQTVLKMLMADLIRYSHARQGF